MPKISCSSCPSRAVLREPQTVEHVVELPTILYFLKQTVDIPVPRGVVGGPQGFFPGQSSSSSTEQIVHTLVRGRGVSGTYQFPVVSGPDPHPSALPADLLGEPIQGFFSNLSPNYKKVRRSVRTRGCNWVRTSLPRPVVMTTTSTLSACG